MLGSRPSIGGKNGRIRNIQSNQYNAICGYLARANAPIVGSVNGTRYRVIQQVSAGRSTKSPRRGLSTTTIHAEGILGNEVSIDLPVAPSAIRVSPTR